MPLSVPVGLDQVNTVGIFQPNSAAVGHEFIMYVMWHQSTVGYATVGQAPPGPTFTKGLFHRGIQFVVVVHGLNFKQ